MNERIEQLLAQTDIPKFPILGSPAWVATDHDMEKFAELIIRECIDACDNITSCRNIEEHFGIEL